MKGGKNERAADRIAEDKEIDWAKIRELCDILFDPAHPGDVFQRVMMVREIERLSKVDLKNTETLRELRKMAIRRTGGRQKRVKEVGGEV